MYTNYDSSKVVRLLFPKYVVSDTHIFTHVTFSSHYLIKFSSGGSSNELKFLHQFSRLIFTRIFHPTSLISSRDFNILISMAIHRVRYNKFFSFDIPPSTILFKLRQRWRKLSSRRQKRIYYECPKRRCFFQCVSLCHFSHSI